MTTNNELGHLGPVTVDGDAVNVRVWGFRTDSPAVYINERAGLSATAGSQARHRTHRRGRTLSLREGQGGSDAGDRSLVHGSLRDASR